MEMSIDLINSNDKKAKVKDNGYNRKLYYLIIFIFHLIII